MRPRHSRRRSRDRTRRRSRGPTGRRRAQLGVAGAAAGCLPRAPHRRASSPIGGGVGSACRPRASSSRSWWCPRRVRANSTRRLSARSGPPRSPTRPSSSSRRTTCSHSRSGSPSFQPHRRRPAALSEEATPSGRGRAPSSRKRSLTSNRDGWAKDSASAQRASARPSSSPRRRDQRSRPECHGSCPMKHCAAMPILIGMGSDSSIPDHSRKNHATNHASIHCGYFDHEEIHPSCQADVELRNHQGATVG